MSASVRWLSFINKMALGKVRDDIDAEIVLDAIYGPLWARLIIGHLPMRASDATRIVDAIWPGIMTTGGHLAAGQE